MNYLFDTCLISELVKKRPNKDVSAWVDSCDEDRIYLSVLTIGEIQKGISKVDSSTRKDTLQHWLDNDLISRFENRIIPIDQEIILTWGLLEGEAEAKGEPIPVIDGLIGATARAHNLTVVTRNVADISRTGARFINPWEL